MRKNFLKSGFEEINEIRKIPEEQQKIIKLEKITQKIEGNFLKSGFEKINKVGKIREQQQKIIKLEKITQKIEENFLKSGFEEINEIGKIREQQQKIIKLEKISENILINEIDNWLETLIQKEALLNIIESRVLDQLDELKTIDIEIIQKKEIFLINERIIKEETNEETNEILGTKSLISNKKIEEITKKKIEELEEAEKIISYTKKNNNKLYIEVSELLLKFPDNIELKYKINLIEKKMNQLENILNGTIQIDLKTDNLTIIDLIIFIEFDLKEFKIELEKKIELENIKTSNRSLYINIVEIIYNYPEFAKDTTITEKFDILGERVEKSKNNNELNIDNILKELQSDLKEFKIELEKKIELK